MVFHLYGSLRGLISSSYPDVKFDDSRFLHSMSSFFHLPLLFVIFFSFLLLISLILLLLQILGKEVAYNMEQQRKFFIEFAGDNKFDPLVPSNWYSRKRDILQVGVHFSLAFYVFFEFIVFAFCLFIHFIFWLGWIFNPGTVPVVSWEGTLV